MRATVAASTARSPSGTTSTSAAGSTNRSSLFSAISSVTRSSPPANPTPGVAGQLLFKRTVVILQLLEIGRTAFVVTDRVELQTGVVQPCLPQPRARDLDDLCVDPGRGAPDRLHVELEELPVAALLRPVVSE